ncbi:MAG: peptidoglycan DD-metalloendopeptidase family protein [Bacillota bacterium]|nr:peptidoglycan DD-metalloendopeptidase family protein [Bacillota bacterium]
MRGTSQNSSPPDWRERLARLRQNLETQGVLHPVRTSLPFLGITAVVLSGAILISSCTLCYTVAIQGHRVTYFEGGEATYQQAVSQAERRTSEILNTDYSFTQEVSLKTTLAPKDRLASTTQVADSIMDTIPELEHVYTLWVDGVMVGASQDSDTINQAMNLVKERYATPDTRSITVDSQVNLRYEYISAETGVLSARELADLLLTEAPRTFPYTVQEGETLEVLLERFGMTQERLQALNPDIDLEAHATAMGLELSEPGEEESEEGSIANLIEIWAAEFGTPLEAGLELTVEQTCPLLVVSTVEEQSLTRTVTPELQTQPDATMFNGEQRILQEGAAGEEAVLARVVKRCGVPVASTDLSAVTTAEATPLIVATGTQPKPQLPDGCLFLWPVRGPITSDYGYRFIFGENNFHRGIDIAAPAGTAINAAADGVVTFAGVKGTYGNLVVVSHQNGFATYYAHCSKLLVSPGDTVTQGQPVAAVGSTGRSTGPHCHFEVRYQNSPIDPLLYLPGENNAPARTEITEEEPEEPAETEEPVTPETPEVPETPALPETPEEPEIPDVPQEPAEPELPHEGGEEAAPAEETAPLNVTAEAALAPESEEQESP